jgi:hypothetical protein
MRAHGAGFRRRRAVAVARHFLSLYPRGVRGGRQPPA